MAGVGQLEDIAEIIVPSRNGEPATDGAGKGGSSEIRGLRSG